MAKSLFVVVNVDWFFLSHRKEVALAALSKGYDVTIVTKDTGKVEEIKKLGFKVIDLPMNRSGKNIIEELKTLNFLYKLYKNKKPDLIHQVGLKVILWGTIAAKLAKAKAIVNAVSGLGIFFSDENKSILSKIVPRLLRYSHKQPCISVIFQNNEDKELFLKHKIITNKEVEFIKGSGIDLNVFKHTSPDDNLKLIILFTARMIEEKGVYVLVEAAECLREKYENKIEFWLCGGIDDNPQAITKDEMDRLTDKNYLKWLGYRTDVLELLKKSDIIAFPSYYREGLPKSLIEATAIGRPIITTNSIGCKETVEDGYNGFLIPIRNAQILSEKIEILINDKALREEMGNNSRLLAEKYFSIENVINRHLEIYKNLIINT